MVVFIGGIGATKLTEKEQLIKMIESHWKADGKIKYDQFRDLVNPQQQAASSRLYIKAYNYAKKIGVSETDFSTLVKSLKPIDKELQRLMKPV
jgi:hypothetical protein